MPADRRRARVGRADGAGAALRHQARRDARARRGARRSGAAAHRRGLLQQQEGAHRVAEVLALRDGPRPAGRRSTRAGSSASRRLREEHARGPARQVVGLEIDWTAVESIYEQLGLPPTVGATASRVAVPVYRGGPAGRPRHHDHVVAGAEEADRAGDRRPSALCRGTMLEIEVTVEAVRHRVKATVVPMPFFNPPRKVATPIAVRGLITCRSRYCVEFDRLLTVLVFQELVIARALTPMRRYVVAVARRAGKALKERGRPTAYTHRRTGRSGRTCVAGEVVFYALVRAGGLPLLTLVATGLILGGWLISWRLASGPIRERFAWVALALIPSSVWWEPRRTPSPSVHHGHGRAPRRQRVARCRSVPPAGEVTAEGYGFRVLGTDRECRRCSLPELPSRTLCGRADARRRRRSGCRWSKSSSWPHPTLPSTSGAAALTSCHAAFDHRGSLLLRAVS